ncbi:MAG: hypothetical protein ACOCUF_03210 [Patescibacteria group bacterium]
MKNSSVEKPGIKNNSGESLEKQKPESAIDRRKFIKMLGVMGLSAGATHILLNQANLFKKINRKRSTAETDLERSPSSQEENAFSETNPSPPEQKVAEKNNYPKHPIGEKILEAYQELPPDLFPPDLFSSDLLIAQQIQESGYRIEAISHANAVGIMQNREISLKDVLRYLKYLNRNEITLYNGPGKDDLSKEKYSELMQALQKNPDYSRAFGKIYLSQLLNQYHIGKEDYRNGNTEEAQKMILAAYNAGPTLIKRTGKQEKMWPKETRDYYKKIFKYRDKLKSAREILHEEKIHLEDYLEDYFVKELVMKMSSVSSSLGQRSIMVKYLKKLKSISRKNKTIAYEDINQVFA